MTSGEELKTKFLSEFFPLEYDKKGLYFSKFKHYPMKYRLIIRKE